MINDGLRRAPHIGTSDEYARCFNDPSFILNDAQGAMLIGHAEAQNLSMREIARFAGFTSFRAGNSRYGVLARNIRERIGLTFERYHVASLADFIGRNLDGEINLRIHDEVVQGLMQAAQTSDCSRYRVALRRVS